MKPNIFKMANLRLHALAWTGCLLVAIALPDAVHAQDALYQQGFSAYRSGDYLNAVKFLFAYKQLASGRFTPAFAQQVDNALNFSEQRLRTALSSSATVESGGKFDKSGEGGQANKPSLPSSPGSSKAVPPRNVVIARPAAIAGTKVIRNGEAAGAEVAVPKSMEEQLSELQRTNADLQQQLAFCQQMEKPMKKKPLKKLPDQ